MLSRENKRNAEILKKAMTKHNTSIDALRQIKLLRKQIKSKSIGTNIETKAKTLNYNNNRFIASFTLIAHSEPALIQGITSSHEFKEKLNEFILK